MYDYGGYYNVCLIGDEVSTPKKTIPRSILFSIIVVAVIYLVMNHLHHRRDAVARGHALAGHRRGLHGADLRQHGRNVHRDPDPDCFIWLGLRDSAGLLAHSLRGGVEGQFFSVFGRLHPKGKFPYVSLLAMGVCSALACLFSLESLITALIVTQTLLQFAAQCVAVMLSAQAEARDCGRRTGCRSTRCRR